jgi:polyphosphate kinase
VRRKVPANRNRWVPLSDGSGFVPLEQVLAIKLTIYRTSAESPIVQALAEAARRGKQVAVPVEITARFDEAPKLAWGRLLEKGNVYVSYGDEKLKTHVKLAMVVREDDDGARRYVHVGTGNYHSGTSRMYEEPGILSCNPELGAEVAAVFNELTSSLSSTDHKHLLVAPHTMRSRFVELIRRQIERAANDRIYGFENDGAPEYFVGSADWMKRNLDRRVETIAPVNAPTLIADIEEILTVAEHDNHAAWDLQPDGTYTRRRPKKGEDARPSQQVFIDIVR